MQALIVLVLALVALASAFVPAQVRFCLCPPGDDPARKAVFDAILSGCIPVIFEVATLFNQYPWHIGEQAALDIVRPRVLPSGLHKNLRFSTFSVCIHTKVT